MTPIEQAQAEVARLQALHAAARERKAWRMHRIKADLDAAEAALAALLPPVPDPAAGPVLKAIPFYEYDVVAGETHKGTLPPLAPDRALIPRYVPPKPAPNPDLSDYCVAPGAQLKGASR